ncbi:hypothetical protein NPIL_39471 [Nephila pilipes]|uniref:Uncharacterized protein n=1 Tax=Nephila pilipes TaxID=299642 RepID=A0A8X6R0E5_NEPPI|nr:hypothetical protein NPIL_39471 [Nephila pilipes]
MMKKEPFNLRVLSYFEAIYLSLNPAENAWIKPVVSIEKISYSNRVHPDIRGRHVISGRQRADEKFVRMTDDSQTHRNASRFIYR